MLVDTRPRRTKASSWVAGAFLAAGAVVLWLTAGALFEQTGSAAGTASVQVLRGFVAGLIGVAVLAAYVYPRYRRVLRAHDELAKRHEMILSAAPVGVFTLDGQGRVTYANHACRRALGFSRKQIVGAHHHELFHHSRPGGSTLPEHACTLMRVFQDGLAAQRESDAFWHRDGRPVAVEYSQTHLPGAEGGETVVLFKEMSQSDKLRKQVDAQVRLLGSIAHDLGNTVTPLDLSIQALVRSSDGRVKERAQWSVTLLARLKRLLASMSDVASFRTGKARLEVVPGDVVSLLDGIVVAHRPIADAKRVRLRLETPDRVPAAFDHARMDQVVSNLVANAIRHTPPEGDVTVALRSHGDRYEIVVRDTGEGFTPDQAENLFRPFTRMTDQEANTGGGIGLGLAIAQELVELHGGTLGATSDGPGKGAWFRIVLPVTPPAEDLAPAGRRPPRPSAAGLRSGGEGTQDEARVHTD